MLGSWQCCLCQSEFFDSVKMYRRVGQRRPHRSSAIILLALAQLRIVALLKFRCEDGCHSECSAIAESTEEWTTAECYPL